MQRGTSSLYARPSAQPSWTWVRRTAGICLALYAALLIFFSLESTAGPTVSMSDKWLHFLAYGGLAGLMAMSWPRMPLKYVFLTGAVLGAGLEIGQGMMGRGRTASIADQIANMCGLLIFILGWMGTVKLWMKYQSRQSRRR